MIKKGITGFGHNGLHNLEFKILQLKRAVLGDGKYKLLEIVEQHGSSNYLEICLEYRYKYRNEKIKILINGQYGYSCCVEYKSKWMNLIFIDLKEDLIKKIHPIFSYLSPEYLNKRIDANDLDLLSDDERKQIKYWNSRTNGEIIFNGYD
jgi:hypothetical protein